MLRLISSHFLLHVPFPHKEIFKQSLCYAAPDLWDKLPDNKSSASSIFAFKRLLKNFILESKINHFKIVYVEVILMYILLLAFYIIVLV